MTTKKSAVISKSLLLHVFSKHDLDVSSLVALVFIPVSAAEMLSA